MTTTDFQRLYRYDAWANARVVTYVKAMPAPPVDVLKCLAHTVLAQELWYNRITGNGPIPADYWEEWPVAESERRCLRMQQLWLEFLQNAGDARLQTHINYVRQGKACTNLVADVLMHMITHNMYHRGQIALLVRTAGGEPLPTDFVAAGREGSLD
jgi:uncharacterized damage-inducible protein DinB